MKTKRRHKVLEVQPRQLCLPDHWETTVRTSWVCWSAEEGTVLTRRREIVPDKSRDKISAPEAAALYAQQMAAAKHGEDALLDLAQDGEEFFVVAEWFNAVLGETNYMPFVVRAEIQVRFDAIPYSE